MVGTPRIDPDLMTLRDLRFLIQTSGMKVSAIRLAVRATSKPVEVFDWAIRISMIRNF